MKMVYLIAFLIVAALFAVYFYPKKNKSTVQGVKQNEARDNPYKDLRNIALKNKPSDIGLELPGDKLTVYGVVMDLGMAEGSATIVAYQTGDASLYISTGGGIIGGGKHQNINDEAKQFVNFAQGFLNKATKTDVTPLPASGRAKFYLLTNKGIEVIEDEIKKFENNTSAFTPLFTEGNKLLYLLHTTPGN